ncbi:hypothetical protein [Actinoplanes sp. DH11]|uniref:hypothetical protein n=1 Tax=Actinoplanes sp. DH11 TaxID=2857011 RepID=UPI001E434A20|nr:hypothetical protein [Actinoplanes sp. DH11]
MKRTLLTAIVSGALVAGGALHASPALAVDPDTKAPTGSFRLGPTSVWTGQKITFSQSAGEYADDRDADAAITRKINWGDGTSTTLAASATGYAKKYTRAGRFTVTETLTDSSRNSWTTPGRTVTVALPAAYGVSKKTVYQGERFFVNITKVQSGTTKIALDWGDGYQDTLKGQNQSLPGVILYRKGTKTKISGKVPMRIAFANKNGSTGWLPLATLTVVKDSTKPKLTITKPKNANRISSWRTVRGTVADKQAGPGFVGATVVRITTSGKYYCLTPKKKWKRYTTDAQFGKYCGTAKNAAKVAKGKWTLKVPAGITKGKVVVVAWTYDRAGNYTGAERTAKITRK